MDAIWQTLIHTPWWVYLILVVLVSRGFQAAKTRVVTLKRLVIIPIALAILMIDTLSESFQMNTFMLSTLIVTVLIGMLIGWWQVHRYALKIDRQNKLIETPGSWSILVVIIVVFAAKYYFGYQLSVNPLLAQQTNFELMTLAVSGLCTGFFIGRLICYLYRFQTLPSVFLTTDSNKK